MLIAAGIAVLGLQDPLAPTSSSSPAARSPAHGAAGRHVLGIVSAPGTPVPRPSPTPDWGLHLVDGNIAQGDLVKVVRRQIRAYGRR